MYPPRSRSRQKGKQSKKRRRRTAWAWINVSMLLLVTAMLTYYFISENGNGGSAPPPAAQGAVSPSPDNSAQEPAPPVTPSPEATETAVPAETPPPLPSATPDATAPPSEDEGAGDNGVADETETQVPDTGTDPSDDADSGNSTGTTEGEEFISGLPPKAGAAGDTVTLNFAGDVIFSGKAGDLLKQKGYDYSYSALDGMFKKDDLTVVNLETPVTTRGTSAANKKFVFKSPPEALDALKTAGVDAVNLANNHTLDQGEQGLRDTLSHLSQRGIPYVGAGLNSKEAYSAHYFERKGIKIALLGFTRVMPEVGWMAGVNSPGLASVYDNTEGLKAIAEAKKKADLVVVVVHWGQERVEQYDSTQQSLGHSFIDAGADLVIGGHPHVMQGIEPYKGKWIAYSTGNFIFTKASIPATWETAVFQAKCNTKGQCSMKLSPMEAELARPVPMNAVDGQLLLKRIESLSSGLVQIDGEGKVTQAKQ